MSRKVVGGSPGPPPCPPNWTRTISQGRTVYATPLGHEIYNLNQLRDFLLSDVTCKCNLPCPLIVDQWFDFSSGSKRDTDDSSQLVNRRKELNHKKSKQPKQPYDAVIVTRILAKNDLTAKLTNDQESSGRNPAEVVQIRPITRNGNAKPISPVALPSNARTNHQHQHEEEQQQQQQYQKQEQQQQQLQQQEQLEFGNGRGEQLVSSNNHVAETNNQRPLYVTTVETPQLYQQPLQVYCSPTPSRSIILNNSVSVQNSILSPQQPEIILNGAASQLPGVDLNAVNNLGNTQGLLSTTQLFPYPHVIDSISPASIVLGVSMGSSVSMGIMGIDSSHLQQIPTLTTARSQDLTQPQGASTLVVSPYGMAPMSLESISCGVLRTPNQTLETSQATLANTASAAATVITAQAAARAANGATLLSPPVPSVCHILPISPLVNTENANPVDSNENALLFNVTLDENSVLLQQQQQQQQQQEQQECEVLE